MGAMPRTTTYREVGDGVDGWGLSVSGREGGEGGAGEARPSWVAALLGQLAREEGREEGMGWADAMGREEGENEPVRLFQFPIPFSIF